MCLGTFLDDRNKSPMYWVMILLTRMTMFALTAQISQAVGYNVSAESEDSVATHPA